jgi:hypothetical protein|tara:strand:+ start:553 stop:936 length:384 start_codon:yes stop_codon:yes gene_type:complete
MELVPITEDYYDFVRILRMHPKTRSGFIEEAQITEDSQEKYMSKHGKDYYVCLLYEGTDFCCPVGYIGVIDEDIRLCTAPSHQGLGIGKFMLQQIKTLYPHATGKIKKNNLASQVIFDSCKIDYKLI